MKIEIPHLHRRTQQKAHLLQGSTMLVYFCLFGIAVGLWLVVSALLNWEWIQALGEWIVTEALFGESAARWLVGLSGAAVVAVSGYYLLRMK